MKPKVYIETTIVGYLTTRISRDLVIAAHQELTKEWWDNRRNDFDLFVSQLVIQEAGAGDEDASQRWLGVLDSVPLLELDKDVIALAHSLVEEKAMPKKAVEDALHIAVSAAHGMDYLLTWNCKHIANAEMRYTIGEACRNNGFEPPVICTPEELMGE